MSNNNPISAENYYIFINIWGGMWAKGEDGKLIFYPYTPPKKIISAHTHLLTGLN